ncbi:hypothetical protein [Amycolatopsis coloradensis]|uniref:hypothetical protein n=1 Tax=Amycolatopsis coloradensis TaxID=76021 RepID=UPI001177BFBE|nr:hypothetical protein [Amycolatopsis coloradensis]
MDLHVALESFAPEYRVETVGLERLSAGLPDSREVDRLSLSLHSIDSSAVSSFDFMQRNPDVLVISPGSRSEDFLRESDMAVMTDDASSLATWKTVMKKARGLMIRGNVSIFNPVLDMQGYPKKGYYSAAARELAKSGTRMLASAGWNEYKIDC